LAGKYFKYFFIDRQEQIGAVALIIALDRALRYGQDARDGSIYDERGY